MKYITIIAATLLLATGCGSSGDDDTPEADDNPVVTPDTIPDPDPDTDPDPDPDTDPDPDPDTDPDPDPDADPDPDTDPDPDPDTDPSGGLFEPSPSDIELDRSIYQQDGYGTLDVIRVDIRTVTTPGICTAEDLSGCTLADVIADTDKRDDLTVDIPVQFQSDDFPDDGSINNAELRLRGGGSRFAAQKSFRIKLDSKEILWRNERHLQLNKHPFDSSRMQNKLAFDLMKNIPHLPSMRTQFVNLWIDDGSGPEDYGLFTHVEKANERYMSKRGLDEDDNLYKAENFSFTESDLRDIAVDATGEPLDEDRFESSIEIEAGKDHRALVAMLTALHNPDRSFESVLDQYFNRNNAMTWMAVNILMGHADATRHNYILYNPAGTEKFYFVPWDYDDAMEPWREPPNSYDPDALRERINYGYAVGDQNVFTSRFYRMPGMHEQMIATAEYLRQNYLVESDLLEMVNRYFVLVEPFQKRAPDDEHNPFFKLSKATGAAESVGKNEEALKSQFSFPMPPDLAEPVLQGDQWVFSWEPAYEVTGNSITYDLDVSSTLGFEPDNIAVSVTGIEDAADQVKQRVDASQLPAGDYYVRLTARASNEPGRFWQVAENRIERDGTRYYGVRAFSVP